MSLEVVSPNSVSESVALLGDPATRFVGGGTLVMRAVNYGDGQIAKLVLPDKLGLDTITVAEGQATLGGTASMASVAAYSDLAFLRPVTAAIGGPAVRAMATVAGNLFAPYPFGDLAVALLALDAMVSVESGDGEKSLAIDAFLAVRDTMPATIVKDVRFTLPPANAFRSRKVTRKHPRGAAVLSIAAVLPQAGGKIAGARVAFGAMAPTAMRASAVEAALEGHALDAAAIESAVKVAADGCAPLTDPQASAWYRLAVLPVHLKRLLAGEV